jgi:lipoate-protein ligase A
MAIDMALADSVRETGQPALRFYRWWPPCLSFGRNQPARGRYDEREAERRGIDFVRRPTGGRPVYHHHEITYSLSVPDRLLGGPRRTHEAIHKALLAGLRLLGAETDIVDAPASVELLRVRREEDRIENATALDQLLEHLPTWSELVDALAGGFERLLGVHLVESSLNAVEHARLIEHSRRFSDPEWTWRL